MEKTHRLQRRAVEIEWGRVRPGEQVDQQTGAEFADFDMYKHEEYEYNRDRADGEKKVSSTYQNVTKV